MGENIEQNRDEIELLYFKSNIGDKTIKFLIDTGSEGLITNEKIIEVEKDIKILITVLVGAI